MKRKPTKPIVPAADAKRDWMGSMMRATATIVGDIVGPTHAEPLAGIVGYAISTRHGIVSARSVVLTA